MFPFVPGINPRNPPSKLGIGEIIGKWVIEKFYYEDIL
jgi:hypothetical protein